MNIPTSLAAAHGPLPCAQGRVGAGCSCTQKPYPLPTSPCVQGEEHPASSEVPP